MCEIKTLRLTLPGKQGRITVTKMDFNQNV